MLALVCSGWSSVYGISDQLNLLCAFLGSCRYNLNSYITVVPSRGSFKSRSDSVQLV